jgi:DNA polymerase gamma 1
MLSKSLHDQLFGRREDIVPREILGAVKEHLSGHGLWGKEGSVVADTHFKLPPLRGKDPDDHFRQIAIDQSEPYLNYAKRLVKKPLPPMPNEWMFHSGWTKYDARTGERCLIDCPEETALILDVEVCVKESPLPVLATAASENAWYSWVCDSLVERKQFGWLSQCVVDNLIPLESHGRGMERLVVGHMVSYDRARIKEQYDFNATHTKFLDTASLHMSVSGFSSLQRALIMKERTTKTKTRQWKKVGALSSLEDIHQFYVGGNALDKSPRDVFVKGTLNDVHANFQHLMSYCAKDVRATHEVLCVLLPLFLSRLPHPVTFAGMLEMGLAYLPIDQSWNEYLDTAEKTFCDLEGEMKSNLMKLADQACSYGHNEQYKSDPWLYGLDWKIPRYLKKRLPKSALNNTHENNHTTNRLIDEDTFQPDTWRQHLSGYPKSV